MKKKIMIVCGGIGPEHEVSLISGNSIYQAISKKKHQPFLVAIGKNGTWYHNKNLDPKSFILDLANPFKTRINKKAQAFKFDGSIDGKKIDLVFPIIQGNWGEDGILQGFLEVLNVPYVGCDLRSSALCIDKILTKIFLEKIGFKTTEFCFYTGLETRPKFSDLQKKIGSKFLIVKAATLGSSVGVYLCKTEQDFTKAWREIKNFKDKILIEKYLKGKEIEVAILGNEKPKAALPSAGIVKGDDILSYEAKYVDEKGTETEIPAKISRQKTKEIQELAIKIFKALNCKGLARVDFFLVGEQEIYFNEVNTLPCFTEKSVYPRSWIASNLEYPALIDQLIELALKS